MTQGSENRVVQRSPESGLAGASVPSGPVVAVGIGMAAVGIGSLCRTFVQIQFAVVADKSQPAFTLIGRHALAAVLARLVAHSCHEKKKDKFSFKFPPQKTQTKRRAKCASLEHKSHRGDLVRINKLNYWAKNRRLTSAIESVALVSGLADAFVLSGRVVAAGIGVASVRSGRALVVFLARVIVDTAVAFDAQTLVRALRVVADRVGTAPVSFRTAYRLAFVDICRSKANSSSSAIFLPANQQVHRGSNCILAPDARARVTYRCSVCRHRSSRIGTDRRTSSAD